MGELLAKTSSGNVWGWEGWGMILGTDTEYRLRSREDGGAEARQGTGVREREGRPGLVCRVIILPDRETGTGRELNCVVCEDSGCTWLWYGVVSLLC